MKKCVQCDIEFPEQRMYCIYCDSPLMDAKKAETVKFIPQASVSKKALKIDDPNSLKGMQYLVSRYFRSKSFSFLYAFSRNQFKMGKKFDRILIQPFDFSVFIKIPLVLVNIVDSFILRLIYKGYCEKCEWKCRVLSTDVDHSGEECDYNTEYGIVLEEILSGKIIKDESKLEQLADLKEKHGKRSAYHHLCSRKRDFEIFIDGISILMSVILIFYIFAKLIMPIFGSIYDF